MRSYYSLVKAQKPHTCAYCYSPIKLGAGYYPTFYGAICERCGYLNDEYYGNWEFSKNAILPDLLNSEYLRCPGCDKAAHSIAFKGRGKTHNVVSAYCDDCSTAWTVNISLHELKKNGFRAVSK